MSDDIELMRAYVHRHDEHISAVPYAINGDQVELNISQHGTLKTGCMTVKDFVEQFELDRSES